MWRVMMFALSISATTAMSRRLSWQLARLSERMAVPPRKSCMGSSKMSTRSPFSFGFWRKETPKYAASLMQRSACVHLVDNCRVLL